MAEIHWAQHYGKSAISIIEERGGKIWGVDLAK